MGSSRSRPPAPESADGGRAGGLRQIGRRPPRARAPAPPAPGAGRGRAALALPPHRRGPGRSRQQRRLLGAARGRAARRGGELSEIDAEIEFRAPAQPGSVRILESGPRRWITDPEGDEVYASIVLLNARTTPGSQMKNAELWPPGQSHPPHRAPRCCAHLAILRRQDEPRTNQRLPPRARHARRARPEQDAGRTRRTRSATPPTASSSAPTCARTTQPGIHWRTPSCSLRCWSRADAGSAPPPTV